MDLAPLELVPLATARLHLEPVTAEMARAVLAGDLSVLAAAGLTAAEGWPHEDTADGLGMIVKTGESLSWLVVTGGAVIGDCGLHGGPPGGPAGPVDEAGRVEIGYGLAAPSRGQGYGSEVVAAITGWLLARPEVRQVRACTLTDNMPSRRVLEKAGFAYTGIEDGEAVYERDAPPA
jgi:RimJ/RimL family protein N-acetyltransferase